MLQFYAGYSHWFNDDHFKQGLALPPDGCFPSRPEEIKILEAVIAANPKHPGGYYYLGNLLYYLEQKELAIKSWETTAALDATFGQVLRNLGFAYSQAGDTDQAIAAYEKAVALEVVTPRLLIELDKLYEKVQKPVADRLALYEEFETVVMKHDDAVIRLLAMFNQAGKFDRAIEILDTRHFHVWEGGGEVHRYFVDAHLLAGMKKMDEAQIAARSVSDGANDPTGHLRSRLLFLEAVKDFELADTYPDHLEVGRPAGRAGNSAKVFYFMGKAYQGLGDSAKAKECFELVGQSRRDRRNADELSFFVGMAYKELGRQAEADTEINALADAVNRQRESRELIDQYSKFGEDGSRSERVAQLQYLLGLVHLARGEKEQADKEFQTAIKANPDLIWARQFLGKP
jgi:tetratricopeptide (TPR) repeat protein